MVWEAIARWPGEAEDGGAFRSAVEPILMERAGLSLRERARLFWHSSPERPLAKVARRAALTLSYLYVERLDGVRQRVSREQLHGVRRDGDRVTIGVLGDEDLTLPFRANCRLQRTLIEALGGGESARWETKRNRGYVLHAVVLAVLGGYLVRDFAAPFRVALATNDDTSPAILGFVGGLAICLLAVLVVSYVPVRIRIDPLGVEVRRGIPGIWVSFLPREAFVATRVERAPLPPRGGGLERPWYVELRLEHPRRFGTLRRTTLLTLDRLDYRFRSDALALADQVDGLLGLANTRQPEADPEDA